MIGKPREAIPLLPTTFAYAFLVAVESGEVEHAYEGSAAGADFTGGQIQRSDGTSASFSLPPGAMNRAAFALKRLFADDSLSFHSAFARFRAVMELKQNKALGPWARPGGDASNSVALHPAVLDVASQMRLSKNGKLPPRKFLSEVRRVATERYADFEQWPLPGE